MVTLRPGHKRVLRGERPALKRYLEWFSVAGGYVNEVLGPSDCALTRSDFTPASISTSRSVSSTPSSCMTWRTDDIGDTNSGCGSIAVVATDSSCFLSI